MYSPKISEDLIPILYTTAKSNKKPMTKIVDSILREHLFQSSTPHSQETQSKSSPS